MGTSQSSSGAPSGVPLVPPWVPALPAPEEGNEGGSPDGQDQTDARPGLQPLKPVPSAPSGRFGPARKSLGRFAQSGLSDDMRRGLRQYVRRGLGGAGMAATRFGGTAHTAGALHNALSMVASGQAAGPGSPLDPVLLRGRSSREVMDAVVEAIRPVDGSLDTEASRVAMRDALSDLLTRFPEADLLNLSEDERTFVIERYVALDVFSRVQLDLGKTIQEKAPSASTALARLRDIRDYIKETVSSAFRKLRQVGQSLSTTRIGQILRQVLKETFEVFEEYVQ
jgi:hypothetical protein